MRASFQPVRASASRANFYLLRGLMRLPFLFRQELHRIDVLAAQCGRRFPSKRRNSINDQWSARRREMLESPAYRVLSQSAHRAISPNSPSSSRTCDHASRRVCQGRCRGQDISRASRSVLNRTFHSVAYILNFLGHGSFPLNGPPVGSQARKTEGKSNCANYPFPYHKRHNSRCPCSGMVFCWF